MKIIATIPTGERTWRLALTPDGQKLSAANNRSLEVFVIDTASNQVGAKIKVGDGPRGIAIQP